MASGYQRPLSWLGSGDSLQPEAPPERRRVAGQAAALSPQQPPRQRAGCERIIVVLVHAVPLGSSSDMSPPASGVAVGVAVTAAVIIANRLDRGELLLSKFILLLIRVKAGV